MAVIVSRSYRGRALRAQSSSTGEPWYWGALAAVTTAAVVAILMGAV